jgi:IclR family KDG regulon transcriptional repressor
VQAVVLALQILDFMARHGGSVGVTELSLALGTSKSRIYRHLRTLVEQNYLVQALDSEKYRIGARLTTLGRLVGQNADIVEAPCATCGMRWGTRSWCRSSKATGSA